MGGAGRHHHSLKNKQLAILMCPNLLHTIPSNSKNHNKIKQLAGDNINISFRTVVQTGGRDGQEELKIAAKSSSNIVLAKLLGVKTKAKKIKKNDEKRDE